MPITNGLQLPFGVQPVNPVPVDSWSGPFTGVDESTAKSTANSAIPGPIRFRTMEVRLLIGSVGSEIAYKYWYYGGTADSDLVLFESGTGITGATGAQVAIYNSSDTQLTAGATGLKFTGTGVQLTSQGDYVTVNIQGSTGATGPGLALYSSSDSLQSVGLTGIKFAGPGVSTSYDNNFVTVNIQGGTGETGPGLSVYSVEGSLLSAGATGIIFQGTGVTVYGTNDFITVGISAAGYVESSAPVTGDGSPVAPVQILYTSDFTTSNDRLSLNLDFLEVVTPIVTSNWVIRSNNNSSPLSTYTITGYGTIGSAMSGNAIQLPNGAYCDYGGTASCPSAGSGQVLPSSTSGTWTWSPDPPSGGNTSYYTTTDISSDDSYSTSFFSPNTGLQIDGTQVVRATGDQSTSASAAVFFKNVFYWGYSNYWGPNNNLSQSAVDALSDSAMSTLISGLGSIKYQYGGKGQTLSGVTTGPGFRLVFAYPASLGDITAIATIPASAPYLGAFIKRTSPVPSSDFSTISGLPADYNVYVGVSDNAFNGVTLQTT
jgi:hypothetical protein